jgi:transposase-like protein/predicted HTH domain antitoxin
MIPDSSTPPCPYCSSVQVIKKGKAIRKYGYKQVYYCKICHKRYCEKKKNPRMELTEDIIESYLFNEGSLDSLIRSKGLTISRTTLFRRILEKARNCPDWPELTADLKARNILGSRIMGVDTSKLKIEGKHHVYFHAVDVTSGNPIAYDVCEKEDIATIEPILRQLKLVGYYPKLTVTDLAPELIASIERVFPDAKIQGCLFHLKMWLDKELPTKKHVRVDQQTVTRWQEVKKLILFAAYSYDWEKRREYLSRIKNLNLDEKAQSVVERFLQNIIYYNTLNRLKEYTNNINEAIYNNLCERHIGLVRKLESKRAGFKSINSAFLQVKSFWFYNIKRKGQLPHTSDDKIVYTPPLPLFDHVNLEEFATATGFPREAIEQLMREKGYEIINNYAFTKTQLEEIKREVVKMRKTSLTEVAKIIGYDKWMTLDILQKVGIKISYSKLDLSDAMITIGSLQNLGHE